MPSNGFTCTGQNFSIPIAHLADCIDGNSCGIWKKNKHFVAV